MSSGSFHVEDSLTFSVVHSYAMLSIHLLVAVFRCSYVSLS